MKKILLFFEFLMSAIMTQAAVHPDTVSYKGVKYYLDGYRAIVARLNIDGPTYTGTVEIPRRILFKDYIYPKVCGVSKEAFSNAPGLVSVHLPNTIEYIEPGAFNNSPDLQEVLINSDQYEWRRGAVYSKPNLSKVLMDFTSMPRPYYGGNGALVQATLAVGPIFMSIDDSKGKSAEFVHWYSTRHNFALSLPANTTFNLKTQSGPITKLKFYFNGTNEMTSSVGSYSDRVWTGNEYNVTFKVQQDVKIDSIAVTLAYSSSQVVLTAPKGWFPQLDDVEALESYSLSGLYRTNVEIPATVKYVADFALSNKHFTCITMLGAPPRVGNNPFGDLNLSTCILKVKDEYLQDYKNHPIWGKFKHIVSKTSQVDKSSLPFVVGNEREFNQNGMVLPRGQRGFIINSKGQKRIKL